MRVYSTLTRQVEDFVPVEGNKVRMYVCGITPYDAAHVGHAMSYLLFDAIRRYLEYSGYDVKHVQNFTDIDDKIIARAQRLGIPSHELAERYIGEFLEDMRRLNVLPAHVYPRATQEVGAIIKLIEGLLEKGFAYVAGGDVYFRVSAFPEYGKLSHRDLEDMRAGARVEVGEQKENPMDFALWKAAKPGEPSWDSPWGPGRPGWHIECSAMSLRYLGEQIDIHGGGQDLIFPHHENEIAQTEAYTGVRPFVRYWLHNGLLQLGKEKMSKSLGNLVTIKQALADYGADALRLFVLTSHYRSPLAYTAEGVEAAKRGAARLAAAATTPLPPEGEYAQEEAVRLAEATARARLAFTAAMDDDFNTPGAVAALFDLARDLNRGREQGAGREAVARAQHTLKELAGVLGFTLVVEDSPEAVAAGPFIDLLLSVRQELRKLKQWALADKIRDELANLGVMVEDRAEGSAWKLKR